VRRALLPEEHRTRHHRVRRRGRIEEGASGTTQFTTSFLSAVKNNDALIQVVRLFRNDAVPHPDGSIDPLRDVATFETEFILADMSVVESRVEKIHKQIGHAHDDQMKKELPVLEKCLALLQRERPLRNEDLTPEELHILKTYQLLSLKPMLIALSLDEWQQSILEKEVSRVAAAKAGLRTRVVAFFGKIDMEISELSGDEARVFLDEYGIKESALDTLIREAYALLGLQSFLTVAPGQSASGCRRRKRFIRAEVVHYDDFIAAEGSFAKAKDAGHWRLDGEELRRQGW
jgi:ribosome-binding ATPase